jgi:ribosomal protein L31E
MNFFYKASLSLVMLGFFMSLMFWNKKAEEQPKEASSLRKKVERKIATDEVKVAAKIPEAIIENNSFHEPKILPVENTIEEMTIKYSLNPKPLSFGDDQYYVSRNFAVIPKVFYKKEMGTVTQELENFLVLKPSRDFSHRLTPLMVDKHTNQIIYATGKVMIKADPKFHDEIVALAERQGLVVSAFYKDISTFYFRSENANDVLKQSKFFSGVPGVLYSQPEVIGSFVKTM